MKMDVKILSKEIIKPSKPTPQNLRTLKLSLLDQCSPLLQVPAILFYPMNDRHLNVPETITLLKKSLSETLTRFYPFAGRIKDSFSIDCNDEGVLYVEARANCRLTDFLAEMDIRLLNKFLPCNPNCKEKDTNVPLFSIQVNILDCGGIVIGTCMMHRIGDGATMSAFLNAWGATTRGGDQAAVVDFTKCSSLFPSRSLPNELYSFLDSLYFREGELKMRRFVFDAKAMVALRAKAASEAIPNPTRVEALTGFLWKRFMQTSKTLRGTSNTSLMTHALNLRRRLDPPLPGDCPGNLVWLATAFFDPQDSYELADVVEVVKETFSNYTAETLKSLQGDEGFAIILQMLSDLGVVYDNVKLETFKFTSWCNLGLYEVEFGWGKPIWVGHMGDVSSSIAKSGVVFIESGCGDGGIEVWMVLDEQQIKVLENDQEFLTFASPNPSIIPC